MRLNVCANVSKPDEIMAWLLETDDRSKTESDFRHSGKGRHILDGKIAAELIGKATGHLARIIFQMIKME